MSGISRKRFRRPTNEGNWHFGRSTSPAPVIIQLGFAISEWGYLEQTIDAVLTGALNAPKVGKALRNNLRSAKQRLALLKEMVAGSADEAMREQVLSLLGEFTALSSERALYAHGVWGSSDGHPEDALLLMDDTVYDISFVDVDLIASGKQQSIQQRMHDNVALVSVRDLERFRAAMARCRQRAEVLLNELSTNSWRQRMGGPTRVDEDAG